ncbi:hypothetical protein OROMI_016882 [Orobanche minor]
MELNWHPLWTIDRIKWPFNSTTDRAYSKNILFPLMIERGIIPTQVEINTRAHILKNLRLVVDNWIGVVGNRQGVKNLTALVVPYGSFGLEVYNGSSDMDLLVIAPKLASEEDFFVVLRENIEANLPVQNMRSIRRAKVPLLKFNVDEVDVDLACARVNTVIIPRAEILHEQQFCIPIALDRSSRLTLQSIMSNWTISQCLQANKENFVQATRFLKHWAIRRGIYGNINCYIGGIHLDVMVAFTCLRCEGKSCAGIISHFFAIFSTWIWEDPVLLGELLTT